MRAKQEGVRATQPIALALQKKKNTKLKMCAIRNDIEIRKLKGNSPRKAMERMKPSIINPNIIT